MDDDIDTDAYCTKPVTLRTITISEVERLRAKYLSCEKVLQEHEMKLVNPKRVEPALDYILKDELSQQYFFKNRQSDEIKHNFEKESRVNSLSFKLKNAIMYHWLQVQKNRSKPSIEELIKQLQEKRRREALDPVAAREAKK
jgi:hypothetical protein